MMMSMFSSVSGLRAHQSQMDVIGNNIANVNTVGFKSSRSTFQEIFSQTFQGASSPDAATGRGGTNPMQVGLGMSVSSIDVMMTSGSVQRTDSPTDISIEGEGFFIVRTGNEGAYTFSRAGNFTIDRMGNLVTATGLNVYGWMKYDQTDSGYEFDKQEPIQAVNLYEDEYNLNKRIIAAQKSTEAVMAGNLDARNSPLIATVADYASLYNRTLFTDEVDAAGAATPDGIPDRGGTNLSPDYLVPLNVYDDLGNAYKININMWKHAVSSEDPSTTGQPAPITSWYYTVSGGNDAPGTNASGFVAFDATGKLVTSDAANLNNIPTITISPNIDTGAQPFNIELNLKQLSMYATDSSVKPLRVDGYPPGTLVTFSVGSDGILTGVYDNGRQQPLGRIGLATFANPAGLQKAGNNLFTATSNSGEFTFASFPGGEGAGSLVPGTLEMSNVDLAKQFTDMIITQRGFQANSRVMTTSDEILQELANMKR